MQAGMFHDRENENFVGVVPRAYPPEQRGQPRGNCPYRHFSARGSRSGGMAPTKNETALLLKGSHCGFGVSSRVALCYFIKIFIILLPLIAYPIFGTGKETDSIGPTSLKSPFPFHVAPPLFVPYIEPYE